MQLLDVIVMDPLCVGRGVAEPLPVITRESG